MQIKVICPYLFRSALSLGKAEQKGFYQYCVNKILWNIRKYSISILIADTKQEKSLRRRLVIDEYLFDDVIPKYE